MLLTIGDLPPGWSVADLGDSSGTTTTTSPGDSFDSQFCPDANNVFKDDSGEDPPQVTFSQAQVGPFLVEMVGPGGASKYATITDALGKCVGQSWTTPDSDGNDTTWTMTELSAADLGDESTAYRMSGTFTAGTATVDIVVGRTDQVVAAVIGMNIQTILGGAPLSGSDFAALVETASNKLG